MNSWEALLAIAVVALAAWIALRAQTSPVQEHRLSRFARRERLVLTGDNTELITRYLGTTRRWRTTFLAAGACYGVGLGLHSDSVRLDVLSALTGWFLGALVAEWRLTSRVPPGLRAASLVPRRLAHHLPLSWRLLPVAVVVATLIVAAAVVTVTPGTPAGFGFGFGFTVAAVAAASILSLLAAGTAARRVVLRPQPAGLEPDVVAAEAVLRRRSVHVLAGCVIAIAGTALASLCTLLPFLSAGAASSGGLAVLLAVLALGHLVATRPRPGLRHGPRTVTG